MKKFVRILAALAVTVAAFAFVSCADGYAVPGDDGNPVVSGAGSGSFTRPAAGTYNLTSITTEEDGTITSTDDGWQDMIDLLGEDFTSIVVSDEGVTFGGTPMEWDAIEALASLGTAPFTVSGNTITIVDEDSGTLVYTKA